MAKKIQYNRALTFVLSIIFFLVGVLAGFFSSYALIIPKNSLITGDFSIHFMELGNSATGDCIYIKAGNNDILIDAGSNQSSKDAITTYINKYVLDKKLEYVIVTHADEDHIANFATAESNLSIFDLYSIGVIIDFAQVKPSRLPVKPTSRYAKYLRERDEAISRGAIHWTALDCVNHTNGATDLFELAPSITMKILKQKFYANVSDDDNEHSVCTLFTHGDRNFLLTGDLEKNGEKSLVEMNDLPKCEFFKAGHHGSPTSSNDVLLNVIQPQICVVSCCAGSPEYSSNAEAIFPTKDFIERIAKHTDKVYIPTEYIDNAKYGEKKYKSMNGNIKIISNENEVKVECSNNNTLLKDSEWFKSHRTCPPQWAKVA